jgi:hypothetical protein
MDQEVSLAARSRRFESIFKPGKVNLNTRRGEALRPHTHINRPHRFPVNRSGLTALVYNASLTPTAVVQ